MGSDTEKDRGWTRYQVVARRLKYGMTVSSGSQARKSDQQRPGNRTRHMTEPYVFVGACVPSQFNRWFSSKLEIYSFWYMLHMLPLAQERKTVLFMHRKIRL